LNVATPVLGATAPTPKFLALFGVVWCYLDIKIFAKHVPAHPAAEDRGGECAPGG
jgi:hypothetical protein